MKVSSVKLIGMIQLFVTFIIFLYDGRVNYSPLASLYNEGLITIIESQLGISLNYYQFYEVFYFFLLIIFLCAVIYAFYSDIKKSFILMVIGASIDIVHKLLPLPFAFSLLISGVNDMSFVAYFLSPCIWVIFITLILVFNRYPPIEEEAIIRKYILEIGTTHADFKLSDISKKYKIEKNTIISVVKNMIRNNEIYADYFNLSKKFIFNKKANLEEIDKLMQMYTEWEERAIGKTV